MSLDLPDDKASLVQVMTWCRQETSHYLSQCWPRSQSPYGVTRPQWIKAGGQGVYELQGIHLAKCHGIIRFIAQWMIVWNVTDFLLYNLRDWQKFCFVHCGLNNVADIFRRHFQVQFPDRILLCFDPNLTERSCISVWSKLSIGSVNGMVAHRWQVISWSSAGQVPWKHVAILGHDDFSTEVTYLLPQSKERCINLFELQHILDDVDRYNTP